jgi:hypothetical protein
VPTALALFPLPETSDQVVTAELSAGSFSTPFTQSARSHKDNPEIPLNALVFGQGFEAVAVVGVKKLKARIKADEITAKDFRRNLNTAKL